MKELYDKTYILSGERLGRIMVQSVQDQGGWMDRSSLPKLRDPLGMDGNGIFTYMNWLLCMVN